MIQAIDDQFCEDVTWSAQSLNETFGVEFEILSCHDEWVCSPSHDHQGCPIQWSALNEVTNAGQPLVVALASQQVMVLIPFRLQSTPCVAISVLETSDPELVHRMSSQWLNTLHLRNQVERLTEENTGFIRQVTDDLEELTFLRQITDQLEATKVSDDTSTLAQQILQMINCSIKCKQIILATVTGANEKSLGWIDEITSTGEPVINKAGCRKIAENYGYRATHQAVIMNRFVSIDHDLKNVRSFILVPFAKPGRMPMGWLMAINRIHNRVDESLDANWDRINSEFGTSEATLLSSAGSMLATQMLNYELFVEKEQLLTSVVRSLVSAIEAKDQYTRGHSERVALYGRRLAKEIGFDEIALQRIYLSGLLHDVGKIGISDETLSKTGKLTEEEFEEIKRHPDEGWAILHGLDQLNLIIPGVLHHHERFDGTGYPDQLVGEAIPIDGRILAVADAFDAMTSDRPYRTGMPIEKAISILNDGAGTQWDTALIQAFMNALPDILFIKNSYEPGIPPQRNPDQSSPASQFILNVR